MANKKKIIPKPTTIPVKKEIEVDLVDEIIFRVDGEEEKNHTLSWEIFKKIGDNTQALINKLSQYSLETEKNLDPLNLKLVVTGFYPGSACPGLRIANDRVSLFPKEKNLTVLNNDFAKVVSFVNDGNFQGIADLYETPELKNDIVDLVYNWTNSAGSKKFQIVKKANDGSGKLTPMAKIRHMKPEQKASLKIYIPTESIQIPRTETEAVGHVTIKVSSRGKKTTKVDHLYPQKEARVSLTFDSIETKDRIYVLGNSVSFEVTDDKKNKSVKIENTLLDIYAVGETMSIAQDDMYDQFDYTYQRLNQFPDNKLSEHLRKAKAYINLIVERIQDK